MAIRIVEERCEVARVVPAVDEPKVGIKDVLLLIDREQMLKEDADTDVGGVLWRIGGLKGERVEAVRKRGVSDRDEHAYEKASHRCRLRPKMMTKLGQLKSCRPP